MTTPNDSALRPQCPWCESPMEPQQQGAFFNAKWACVCTNCGAVGPGVFEVADLRNERPLGKQEEAKLDAIRAATRPQPAEAPRQRQVPTDEERWEVLRDLAAIVRGECPSLLNEDSGGDADLDARINAALVKPVPPASSETGLREAWDPYNLEALERGLAEGFAPDFDECAKLIRTARAFGKLRPEVLAFARMMEAQLKRNDHRGGWKACTVDYLLDRLRANMDDLEAGHRIGHTLADLANFAMMLADVSDQLPKEKP